LIAAALLSGRRYFLCSITSLRSIEMSLRLNEPDLCTQFRRVVNIERLVKFSRQIGDASRLYTKLIGNRWFGFAEGKPDPNF
jgi:hypothetical protein